MVHDNGQPSTIKKVMFSYYPDSTRPRNAGVQKRWQDRIKSDLDHYNIRNWRRETLDRDKWRSTINRAAHVKPPVPNILDIVQQFKQRSTARKAASTAPPPPKVVELIPRNVKSTYTCPQCKKEFKPQGITKHARSCAKQWCKTNGIHVD
jgi:hypothetical protein